MRIAILFAALIAGIAVSPAWAQQDDALSLREFVGRVTAATRSAHDLTRDAQGALTRSRPLPEAVLQARLRQLARDLAQIKGRVVALDEDRRVRVDTTFLESRIWSLQPEMSAAELRTASMAIESSLREFGAQAVALDRMAAEARRDRLARLDARRHLVADELTRPEYQVDPTGETQKGGWAEQLAAFLERLFRLEIPGWATRGSEILLVLVVATGVLLTVRFLLGRRRGGGGVAGGEGAPAPFRPAPAAPGDPALARECAEALRLGDFPAAVRLACLMRVQQCAARHGPERWRALTNRELLDRWRGTARAEEWARAGEMIDLHAEVWYAGRTPVDVAERVSRALAQEVGGPPGTAGTGPSQRG